jgi:ABC-type bacteriocin/lantibiotic exporter with double-glycine peptidase domain
MSRRRWLVPETVQTSAMDCGPAVLKAALAGHGIAVEYGRLREACQTDVDGTSINALEETANQLGLQATQEMLPVDHLPLPETAAIPAILVTCLSDGSTHFILVWWRQGPLVQVLDPAAGRRWLPVQRLLQETFLARALLQRSDLMLFDETFGALDPATLQETIRHVQKEAKTMVVIAHP